MNLIFSADNNWGIGKDNKLLFRAQGDMRYFRRLTTGGTVIMGRKTLESLPDAKPLPERENVVLTRAPGFSVPGAAVCHSLEELFAYLKDKDDDNIFVIGGAEIYRQLEPYCMRAFVTRWDAIKEADSYAPDLDKAEGWFLLEESSTRDDGKAPYRFCTYLQKKPQPWK